MQDGHYRIVAVFLVSCLFALPACVSTAGKEARVFSVSSCKNLTIPNSTYVLANSVDAAGADCFGILADNITLDCRGHEIIGNNSSSGGRHFAGAWSEGSGTRIKNCIISGFQVGIGLGSYPKGKPSDYAEIKNVTVLAYPPAGLGAGIAVRGSQGVKIVDSRIYCNGGDAVYFESGAGNYVVSNTSAVSETEYGISFYSAGGRTENATIANSFISGKAGGISFCGISGNNRNENTLIANNTFSQSEFSFLFGSEPGAAAFEKALKENGLPLSIDGKDAEAIDSMKNEGDSVDLAFGERKFFVKRAAGRLNLYEFHTPCIEVCTGSRNTTLVNNSFINCVPVITRK